MADVLTRVVRRIVGVAAVTAIIAFSTIAAHGKEALPLDADPVLEGRVMKVAEELRCLVCQNETIAASQAGLAVDLRKQIRVKLQQGLSNEQIVDFMVERYGAFVRYRPAFDATTALLWMGPFLMLALGSFVLAKNIQRRRIELEPEPLTEAETRHSNELLAAGTDADRRSAQVGP